MIAARSLVARTVGCVMEKELVVLALENVTGVFIDAKLTKGFTGFWLPCLVPISSGV